jgi:hypothetical protein
MSGLHPIATKERTPCDVSNVPNSEVSTALDDLVGAYRNGTVRTSVLAALRLMTG